MVTASRLQPHNEAPLEAWGAPFSPAPGPLSDQRMVTPSAPGVGLFDLRARDGGCFRRAVEVGYGIRVGPIVGPDGGHADRNPVELSWLSGLGDIERVPYAERVSPMQPAKGNCSSIDLHCRLNRRRCAAVGVGAEGQAQPDVGRAQALPYRGAEHTATAVIAIDLVGPEQRYEIDLAFAIQSQPVGERRQRGLGPEVPLSVRTQREQRTNAREQDYDTRRLHSLSLPSAPRSTPARLL